MAGASSRNRDGSENFVASRNITEVPAAVAAGAGAGGGGGGGVPWYPLPSAILPDLDEETLIETQLPRTPRPEPEGQRHLAEALGPEAS